MTFARLEAPSEVIARPRSKGVRSRLRSAIRGRLGTSSDPAPTALDALSIVPTVAELLVYATSGRYTVAVVDTRTKAVVPHREAVRGVAEAVDARIGHRVQS